MLGWSFLPNFPGPGGEHHLFLYSIQGGGSIPYIHVEDAHAAYEKALSVGAREMLSPTRVMEGVTAAVVRARGVAIGLSGP